MEMYLICYGDDNLMATSQADDTAHAVEQFCISDLVDAENEDVAREAINEIFICTSVPIED